MPQTADELRREQGREAEHHEQTRIQLADVETNLGSASEQIEALEAIRQQLLDEIAKLMESAQEQDLELQRHETTRAELTAARESLADSEAKLQESEDKIEALRSVRCELQAEIATLSEAMEKRRQEHGIEPDQYDRTRLELANSRTELAETEQMLVDSQAGIEEQRRQLDQADRTRRQDRQAL